MTSDYVPISCALHSEYELAIMHKTKLALNYLDDTQTQCSIIASPVDLQTYQGAEYLLLTYGNNENMRLRLDHILEMRMLQK